MNTYPRSKAKRTANTKLYLEVLFFTIFWYCRIKKMNDYKDNVESQILTVGEGSEKYGIEEGEEEF